MVSYLIKVGVGMCYLVGGVESISIFFFEKRVCFFFDKIGDFDMGIVVENVV